MDIVIYIILAVLLVGIGAIAYVLFLLSQKMQNLTVKEDTQTLLLLKQSIDTLGQNSVKNMNDVTKNLLQQLNDVTRQVDSRLKENQNLFTESNKTIGDRLDNAAKAYVAVHNKLSSLEEANKRIYDVGRDISSLQEILKAPKLRGALGELFLGDILHQILPKDRFQTQYTFKSGEVVDAIIKFKDEIMVSVDAKFPLESFRRMLDAQEEDAKKAAKKEFIKSVKNRIQEISEKYILPDEGTMDFAMMYIPAENVYYEIIIKDEEQNHLMQFAFDKHVIPVSPNSFYAYLQTILLGLKGMQVEQSTKEILTHLAQLQVNFTKFQEEYELVGKHLNHAKNSYDGSARRLEKLEDKMGTDMSKIEAPKTLI